jgi:uncharacterized protein YdaU (DUF1376 family)
MSTDRRQQPARRDPMHSFPLHVGDWIGSEAIQTLSAAGEHAYLRLCLNQWKNEADGLPPEPAKLRMFTKLTPKEWAEVWAVLEAYFPVCDDNRRRNPRTEKERLFALALREKRRQSGQKGAETRWQTDSPAIAVPLVGHWQTDSPSPSPSPSHSSVSSPVAVHRDSEKQLHQLPSTRTHARGRDPRSIGAVASDLMAQAEAKRGVA